MSINKILFKICEFKDFYALPILTFVADLLMNHQAISWKLSFELSSGTLVVDPVNHRVDFTLFEGCHAGEGMSGSSGSIDRNLSRFSLNICKLQFVRPR